MKIVENTISVNNIADENRAGNKLPAFKGAFVSSAINGVGSTMQGIESQGFWLSFLIQDFLGMSMPRGIAGFLRDKEVTGEYNIQEGFEVLGRECLTGPCMMAVAPVGLLLAAKCGKLTATNSQLIKRFGDSLKGMLKSGFDKNLLNDKNKFKEEFYKKNIREILNNTLKPENVKDEHVENILKEIRNYENIPKNADVKGLFGKSKYKNKCISNITEYIDNIRYTLSDDLNHIQQVKVGAGENQKYFSIKNAMEGMIKYSDDAITCNKYMDKLDEVMAESIKNNALAKRFITNISLVASTLIILSILPKIYAKSKVAPGAKTAKMIHEANLAKENLQNNDEKQNTLGIENEKEASLVSFKGKTPDKSWLTRFGKYVSEHTSDNFSSHFEYDGHNFTPSLMATLSVFGLIGPRGWHAFKRAQVDEDGKKDYTEIYEILIRDLTSSLAVVFAVPILTKMLVSSYEKKTGYVLIKNNNSNKSKFLQLINPYSASKVLSNSEIETLYNNVDTKAKMLNFCKYIDDNGGDLEKIISKSENSKEIFGENLLNLSSVKDRKAKNKAIKEYIEKMVEGTETDNKIAKIMNISKKSNKIASQARGLVSLPLALTTFFISPFILGWIIPRLTYANTRRIHAKKEQEAMAKAQAKSNTNLNVAG